MRIAVYEDEEIRIPNEVKDLPSFQRWRKATAPPRRGRVSYLMGEVAVAFSEERAAHHVLRCQVAAVLGTLVLAAGRGRYFWGGEWLSSVEGEFATQPDGIFVSEESLRGERVKMVGPDELLGGPDMALEVVSRSSVTKDTVTLRQAYATAGVSEYWLVNPRVAPMTFDLLVLLKGVYRPTRNEAGWNFSPAFSRWFKLVPIRGALFTLESRTERP